MVKSKFDTSLLTPVESEGSQWDPSLLEPVEEQPKQKFKVPKQEGINTWLPRDIMIGLSNLGHNTLNSPYNMAKNIENQGQEFGNAINQTLPMEQYLGKNRLPNNQSYLHQLVEGFNKEHNVPESVKNPLFGKSLAEHIPHQKEYDFASLLGQKETPDTGDWLIQKGIEHAPEILGVTQLARHLTPQRIKDLLSYKKLNKEQTGLHENIKTAESNLENIEGSAAEQNKALENVTSESNQNVGQYLNEGANHAVRGASGMSHRLNNIEKYWKDSYKNLKNNLKESQFQMEDLPKFGSDLEHTIKNIKDLEVVNGKLVIKNQPEVSSELQSIIDKIPKQTDTSADKFLTKYQDLRDARYDLLQRAKNATTSSERKALFKAFEDSKPIEETVTKALHEGLGQHKEEFARVNKGYSEQIYPLRNNKIAQKALKGKLGPNTMEDLAGTGEGQELLREIVKQDPELLRNIVGQRYAAKPESLHNINETTAEYLYEMPELKKIMAENESKINEQLGEVNKLKSKKEITLKQKLDYEKQAKDLKNKLHRIEQDRAKIWRGTKKAAKVGAALYVGGSILDKIIGK